MYNTPKNQYGITETNIQLTDLEFSSMLTLIAAIVPENELFTIDCPGMGCVLLNTDVFRKVPYPWFDLKEGKYGQDIYFWSKAKDNGIKVGVDSSIQCGHLCERRVVDIQDYKDWLLKHKTDKAGFVLTSPRNSVKGGNLNVTAK